VQPGKQDAGIRVDDLVELEPFRESAGQLGRTVNLTAQHRVNLQVGFGGVTTEHFRQLDNADARSGVVGDRVSVSRRKFMAGGLARLGGPPENLSLSGGVSSAGGFGVGMVWFSPLLVFDPRARAREFAAAKKIC
jgi:hypothetical protein